MIASETFTTDTFSLEKVRQVCEIKKQFWPYSDVEQLDWWAKNTEADDVFITVTQQKSIIAFLRLRSRFASLTSEQIEVFCVTEVCVHQSFQNLGFGKQLMNTASSFVNASDVKIGFLLCFEDQIDFYKACNWFEYPSVKIKSKRTGDLRNLRNNERCMAFDPELRLQDKVLLHGDVF